MNTDTIATDADRLRNALVDSIKSDGHARTPEVEAALRTIPRHLFVPDAPLEDAYANEAVITKRDSNGEFLSCASVPSLVAAMLDWLDIQPGHRILEIGAGTNYNAALTAYLTGSDGQVTTIDIGWDAGEKRTDGPEHLAPPAGR